MMDKAAAIITARGGSKRILHKNIKEFCGKPILAYSIEAALKSNLFHEVMVSTDDLEIAEVAQQYGASVPFMRSAETSDDFATTADVLFEVLENYRKIGKIFQKICCLYPTAPFITAEKIKIAMELLNKGDSVVPIVKYSFPPQRSMIIQESGYIRWKFKENRNLRSQDLEPYYHDCGQFYCLRTKRFIETRELIMEHTIPMIIPELEVQDIDNQEDWEIAELKYQHMCR